MGDWPGGVGVGDAWLIMVPLGRQSIRPCYGGANIELSGIDRQRRAFRRIPCGLDSQYVPTLIIIWAAKGSRIERHHAPEPAWSPTVPWERAIG